jgi:hypothetical protein
MAILTKPGSISKGTSVDFTLNIEDLVVHPGITDAYYQDPSNLKRVVFFYESAVGNQTKRVRFEIQNGVLTGKFSSSPKVRDLFHLKTIFLYDFDGAFFALERPALSAEDKTNLDVALA